MPSIHLSPRPKHLDVLIVDDAVTVRRSLRAMLEAAAVEAGNIREAGTAREALAAFDERIPDLVLFDLVLPDLAGEEVG
jgi:YesN/AraC family two-component response regulator